MLLITQFVKESEFFHPFLEDAEVKSQLSNDFIAIDFTPPFEIEDVRLLQSITVKTQIGDIKRQIEDQDLLQSIIVENQIEDMNKLPTLMHAASFFQNQTLTNLFVTLLNTMCKYDDSRLKTIATAVNVYWLGDLGKLNSAAKVWLGLLTLPLKASQMDSSCYSCLKFHNPKTDFTSFKFLNKCVKNTDDLYCYDLINSIDVIKNRNHLKSPLQYGKHVFDKLINILATHGKILSLKQFTACFNKDNWIRYRDSDLQRRAAENGHVAILDWCSSFLKIDNCIPQFAASHGQVGVLQWGAKNGLNFRVCNSASAAENGHLPVLRWLLENQKPISIACKPLAIKGGYFDILQWLAENNLWTVSNADNLICEKAALIGNLPGLIWARSQGFVWNARVCSNAAEKGHLEILKWARSQTPPCPWSKHTCSLAAKGGHLEVLQWARSQSPPCYWAANTCSLAAKGGHLHVLKWARAQSPPCPWNVLTCTYAAENGHLEVLKWVRSQNPPCRWDVGACIAAAGGGHFKTLQWLRSQHPQCPWNSNVIKKAAIAGHVKCVKWAYANRCQMPNEFFEYAISARFNSIHMLKWGLLLNPLPKWDAYLCACASKLYKFKVLRWLRANGCPWDNRTFRHSSYSKMRNWIVTNKCLRV